MNARTLSTTTVLLLATMIVFPDCKSDPPHCASGLLDTKTSRCLTVDGGGGSAGSVGGTAGTDSGNGGLAGATTGPGGAGGARAGLAGAGGGGGIGGLPGHPDAGTDAPAACTTAAQCAGTPMTPVCDPSTGACVGCGAPTDCGGATPVCDPATKKCVGCAAHADCKGATPACDTKTKTCVACLGNVDCTTTAAPICETASHTCVGCAAATDCTAPKSVCDPVAKMCVGCLSRADCAAPTPACDTVAKACVGCLTNADCGGKTPLCDAAAKKCVQCLANSDCAGGTPICDARACRSCLNDKDCAAQFGPNPGVCMAHQDGRCATDAETIYVALKKGCSDNPDLSVGASAVPFCSMELAVPLLGMARDLILVRGEQAVSSGPPISVMSREASIIGQNNAQIGGPDSAIRLVNGSLYVRDIQLTTSGVGCEAQYGTTLRMDHVLATGNLGGGLQLLGASFDIKNTIVSANGMGQIDDGMGGMGPHDLGGIYVTFGNPAAMAKFTQVTVNNNFGIGIWCESPVSATDVFASNNTLGDIDILCGFHSCDPASATCGATP